jgi:hypothetical protein
LAVPLSVAVAGSLPLIPGVAMSVLLIVPLGVEPVVPGVAMPELSILEPAGIDAAGGLPGVVWFQLPAWPGVVPIPVVLAAPG